MLGDLFRTDPGGTKNYSVRKSLSLVAVVIFALSVMLPTPVVRAEEEKGESAPCSKSLERVTCYVLQPFYLIGKTAVAITGTVISFVTLVGTLGDEEAAKNILNDSLGGPWGMPELLKTVESDSSQSG